MRRLAGLQLDQIPGGEPGALGVSGPGPAGPDIVTEVTFSDRIPFFRFDVFLPPAFLPGGPRTVALIPQVQRPAAGPKRRAGGSVRAVCRNTCREGITLAMRFKLEGRPCIS